ncbi:MAG: hypothetical protein RE468_11915 [Acidithiobacillus caldus]|uniref:Uncharacterized protein n=1 Tax=Acidithiobacillus caldus TaxID=33059 RepID=A0A1E7YVM2_9PROT|nr:hypothetical protein [Acidithiobacillus caldus]OFC60516.1 hypothetical protein BAE30_07955 [Acidithiobacillus caldus]WMT46584.1 MAG: hypothetical protein RE468_11915 [Acidithiobacillus caldus]
MFESFTISDLELLLHEHLRYQPKLGDSISELLVAIDKRKQEIGERSLFTPASRLFEVEEKQ